MVKHLGSATSTLVSMRMERCEKLIPSHSAQLLRPNGCMLVQYPEFKSRDVLVIQDEVGREEESGYLGFGTLGSPKDKIFVSVRSEEEGNFEVTYFAWAQMIIVSQSVNLSLIEICQVTFKNPITEKSYTYSNIADGKKFKIDSEALTKDALEMDLQTAHDKYDFSKVLNLK